MSASVRNFFPCRKIGSHDELTGFGASNGVQNYEQHDYTEAENIIKKFSREEFDEIKTKCVWESLPDSVIGTLIYFLLIEHNDSEFELFVTLKYLITVGFPVYFTFFLQAVIIYELYLYTSISSDPDTSYCATSPILLFAIIAVYLIFNIPSAKSILTETQILFHSDEAAFQHDRESSNIKTQALLANSAKRCFLWLVIVLPETLLLLFCNFAGIYYVSVITNFVE